MSETAMFQQLPSPRGEDVCSGNCDRTRVGGPQIHRAPEELIGRLRDAVTVSP